MRLVLSGSADRVGDRVEIDESGFYIQEGVNLDCLKCGEPIERLNIGTTTRAEPGNRISYPAQCIACCEEMGRVVEPAPVYSPSLDPDDLPF